jgi:hypothetical protein
VVAGGPRLGDLESGSVAAVASPAFSVVSGGLACIGGVLVAAAAVPALVRYDARQAIEAAERDLPADLPSDEAGPPEIPARQAAAPTMETSASETGSPTG